MTFICAETGVTVQCHRKTAEPVILSFKRNGDGLIRFGVEDVKKTVHLSIGSINGGKMVIVESAGGDIDSPFGFVLHPEKDESVADLTVSETGEVALPACSLAESFDPFGGGVQKNLKPIKQGRFAARKNDSGKLELLWGSSLAVCPPAN